ncbi:hypothetical protein [Endozoicomonas lisbonensis]|uniref:Uncharacterized protein n=1 Tax=Endozoicomonas lisbonensis TaxID=3120522 RepID=A0ABV2SL48_9GAMM
MKDIALILFIGLAFNELTLRSFDVISRKRLTEAETHAFSQFEQIMNVRDCKPEKIIVTSNKEKEMIKKNVKWNCSGVVYEWAS